VKKSSFYHTTLAFDAPVRGFPLEYRHPVWYGKTTMVSLPDGEKMWRYVYSFWRDPRTWQTDGQTNKQTNIQTNIQTPHDSIDRACIASRGKNEMKLLSENIDSSKNFDSFKPFWTNWPQVKNISKKPQQSNFKRQKSVHFTTVIRKVPQFHIFLKNVINRKQ